MKQESHGFSRESFKIIITAAIWIIEEGIGQINK